MIAIIDYGMGNLRSVQKAIERIGAQATITQDINEIHAADKLVLPGVGAMEPAINKLKDLGLDEPIKKFVKKGKPFLGICLGFQLLFEKSDEGGHVTGLGLLKGNVKRFSRSHHESLNYPSLKVPHMGWNQLKIKNGRSPLLKGIDDMSDVYFCHSYYVNPDDHDINSSVTNYGIEFSSSISKENIFGVQFHPEKSQTTGLKILKNFTEIKS